MANPLTVEKWHATSGINTMRVSGFTDGELGELKSMEHGEATEALLGMLDNRNGGIGTEWHNGYGIYGVWYDNEYAYINIGRSCD